MAGQRVDAKMDVCLMDELELLLVQEDKVSTQSGLSLALTELLLADLVE